MQHELIAFLQVVIIDIVLAGDNAVVVGLAASRGKPELRAQVIMWGIGGAVVLRILFAVFATELLTLIGLTLAGGILLLWVSWKLYRELTHQRGHAGPNPAHLETADAAPLPFWPAVRTIIVADVSMSLDNALAVAGAAKGHLWVLAAGLTLSVVLMAVAATLIANLLARYRWMSWVGLLVVLFVALDMIWAGTYEVGCRFVPQAICERGLLAVIKDLI